MTISPNGICVCLVVDCEKLETRLKLEALTLVIVIALCFVTGVCVPDGDCDCGTSGCCNGCDCGDCNCDSFWTIDFCVWRRFRRRTNNRMITPINSAATPTTIPTIAPVGMPLDDGVSAEMTELTVELFAGDVTGDTLTIGDDTGSGMGGDEGGRGGGGGISKISTTFEVLLILFAPPPKNILFVAVVAASTERG
jgi:hypothetical protein